jgi:hypothetical protein
MPRQLSEWVKKARALWPRSHREKVIHGDGQYAVLTCPHFHPSSRSIQYSEVYLFPTYEQAFEFQRGLDNYCATYESKPIAGVLAYCHAATKNLCRGKHTVVNLSNGKEESGPQV